MTSSGDCTLGKMLQFYAKQQKLLKIITRMRKDEEKGSCEEAAKASCIEFLQGRDFITIYKCLAEKLCGIRQNEMQWFEGKVSYIRLGIKVISERSRQNNFQRKTMAYLLSLVTKLSYLKKKKSKRS